MLAIYATLITERNRTGVESMFCLKEDQFYLDSGKKVIKAEEYATFLEANTIIEEAKKKAARIIEESKAVFESEKKRGFQEGIEEGNKRISELMIESVAKSVKNFERFGNDIIDVVMQALQKIVGEMKDEDLITGIVKTSMKMVRDQKKVTIIVSPEEEKIVRERLNDIMSGFPEITFVNVDIDPRLKKGSCMLVTEMGMVDATLDVQLESIHKSLTKVIK